jgi:hypothetical protein
LFDKAMKVYRSWDKERHMGAAVRGTKWALLGITAALWLASPLFGDNPKPTGKGGASVGANVGNKGGSAGSAAKADAKGAPADPVAVAVESAFALPKGVVLNAKQQKAFNKLKKENESPLRTAVRQTIQATDKGEKAKAARQANDLRATIHSGIKEIVAMGYADAQAAIAREYAKRAAAVKAARSSAAACPCGR